MSEMSRRNFLVGAGMATGALAAVSAGIVKPGTAEAAYTALPWPYATLNLDVVRRRAYDNYYVAGCMYGTASALINTLVETVGAPWDTLPIDMFKYGAGGVYSWGTTCGALNGAAYVIQLAGGASVNPVIDELFGWYCNFPFPSKDCDAYAVYTKQRTTIANSPLCHASVSNWCGSTNMRVNGPEKKDRCAKVAADTAAKAAEYLNAVMAGTFQPAFVPPDATCRSCHVGPTSTYDHVQMKSTCTAYCHDDKLRKHP